MEDLSDDIEVCPVEFPGRGTRHRELPFNRLGSLVKTISRALVPFMDKPFAFFGGSVGAIVCFEIARWLCRYQGVSPIHLFVSGCGAPQIPDPALPIHGLPDQEFIKELSLLDGTPKEILECTELMQMMLPVLRADYAVHETYVYERQPPLDCPISVYGGIKDHTVSYERLLAWRDQTISTFKLKLFQAGHFFLHSHKQQLLQALSKDLSSYTSKISIG